jgi:predicted nucleotidyltransferase
MALDLELVQELSGAHAAHTVILYGSRARGDAGPESDVDVTAFADVSEGYRDARLWKGLYLDAFIEPTAEADGPAREEQLKLLGGRVLLDERGLGARLLERLRELNARGPRPLSESERRLRRVWAHKMLARIGRDDLEARYRHHWLLFQILEDDFTLRDEWYRGPKLALVELAARRPATHAALVRALEPGAPREALVSLVALVAGPAPELKERRGP